MAHYTAVGQRFKWLKTENDTSYISDRTNDLIARTFVANKFTKYAIGNYSYHNRLSYMANDNYNVGVGANYKYIGLNVGLKLPFVNNDTAKYGKTKFFDLQSFVYLRKITLDLYLLSYNGYYLASRSMLNVPPVTNVFPRRGDLRTRNIGLNAQYIFNSKRFSFRAAYLQNEQQRKSAGSFLAGAGIHVIRVRADSSLIPSDIKYDAYFGGDSYTGSNIVSLGINGGYAHTFVIHNYFITAALLGGAGLNYTAIMSALPSGSERSLDLQLNGIVRLAAGYSSSTYFAGVQYINFINRNNAPFDGTWQEVQTGNVRFTLAKRFKLKKSTKKKIKKVETSIKDKLGIPDGPK